MPESNASRAVSPIGGPFFAHSSFVTPSDDRIVANPDMNTQMGRGLGAERYEEIAGAVFEPLQRYLRRRAPRHDAEDVLSDVLLTLWRRVDDVPVGSEIPWAYGVARRALANQRRGNQRHLRLVEKLQSEPATIHPDPAESSADPDLEAAMSRLDIADREVLSLWAWEQLEPREVATVLGTSVNAATLRLSRAKKRLRAELGRQNSPLAGHNPVKGTKERRDD